MLVCVCMRACMHLRPAHACGHSGVHVRAERAARLSRHSILPPGPQAQASAPPRTHTACRGPLPGSRTGEGLLVQQPGVVKEVEAWLALATTTLRATSVRARAPPNARAPALGNALPVPWLWGVAQGHRGAAQRCGAPGCWVRAWAPAACIPSPDDQTLKSDRPTHIPPHTYARACTHANTHTHTLTHAHTFTRSHMRARAHTRAHRCA